MLAAGGSCGDGGRRLSVIERGGGVSNRPTRAVRQRRSNGACRAGATAALLTAAMVARGAGGMAEQPGGMEPSSQPGQAAVQDDVSAMLESIRARHGVPALAGAIVTEAGVRAIGVAGVRRAGDSTAAEAGDAWHLGSCTKAMTATLIARLVERGVMSWETTPADALPGLREEMDAAWGGVSVAELLAHRGGVSGEIEGKLWQQLWEHRGSAEQARRQLARAVLSRPPAYKPGTATVYSNAGYAMAGHMAETMAGESWEALMQREVFEPLGMAGMGFGAPGSAGRVDQPRGHDARGRPIEPGPNADNPPAIGPAGRVHGPLASWSKFVAAHLRGARGEVVQDIHGKVYLTQASFDRLHGGLRGEGAPALGWLVAARDWARGDAATDRGVVLTHAGSNTMWFAVVWMAPERGFAVVSTANQGGDRAARACDAAAWALIQRHLPAR